MNPNVRVTPMSADLAIKEWDVIKSVITKVMDQACGRFTLEDVKERIASGHVMPMMIWDPTTQVIYSVICAEAEEYPLKKVFQLSICAGEDIEEWGHVYPAIKDIARAMGFDQIDIVGRRGWKKFLPGATTDLGVFIEDLNDAEQDQEQE